MTYLVSFSEDDLDLIREALELAARDAHSFPGGAAMAKRYERMNVELGELKARQDAA